MAYYRCVIGNKEKESIYKKEFLHTWNKSMSSPPVFDIDLSSIPVYRMISMQNIHFANIVGTYDRIYDVKGGNFSVFTNIEGEYDQNTGILHVTFHGVARLFPGQVHLTVIIIL